LLPIAQYFSLKLFLQYIIIIIILMYIYVRCVIFTVRNFNLALSADLFFIGYLYCRVSPKWPGFMGDPDHSSSPYIPDDQGTAILSSLMLFSFLCSYSLLSIWSH